MYFDEDFVKSLPHDWNYAAVMLRDKFYLFLGTLNPDQQYSATQQLWALLKVLREDKRHPFNVPNLTGQHNMDIGMIKNVVDGFTKEAEKQIESQNEKAKLIHYEDVYRISLGNVFHFEFSEGDLQRIQKLANELRDLISISGEIEEKHKQRLLRKLERFQSELHKKTSDLDRTWGFLLEASTCLGQMGENVKPMVDRIRELVGIIGPTHARAYDLPSNLPIKLLGSSEDEKS